MQYSDFRKFVRHERESLGISLNSFALNSDLEPATLSNFETGKSDVLFETFIKIAQGFGLTPSQLLSKYEKQKGFLK